MQPSYKLEMMEIDFSDLKPSCGVQVKQMLQQRDEEMDQVCVCLCVPVGVYVCVCVCACVCVMCTGVCACVYTCACRR